MRGRRKRNKRRERQDIWPTPIYSVRWGCRVEGGGVVASSSSEASCLPKAFRSSREEEEEKKNKGCDFTIQPQTPRLSGQTALLRPGFRGRFLAVLARFRPFSANFGQKRPKSTRNRLLLKGLLRVLAGAGEGVCGCESGHKTKAQTTQPETRKNKP